MLTHHRGEPRHLLSRKLAALLVVVLAAAGLWLYLGQGEDGGTAVGPAMVGELESRAGVEPDVLPLDAELEATRRREGTLGRDHELLIEPQGRWSGSEEGTLVLAERATKALHELEVRELTALLPAGLLGKSVDVLRVELGERLYTYVPLVLPSATGGEPRRLPVLEGAPEYFSAVAEGGGLVVLTSVGSAGEIQLGSQVALQAPSTLRYSTWALPTGIGGPRAFEILFEGYERVLLETSSPAEYPDFRSVSFGQSGSLNLTINAPRRPGAFEVHLDLEGDRVDRRFSLGHLDWSHVGTGWVHRRKDDHLGAGTTTVFLGLPGSDTYLQERTVQIDPGRTTEVVMQVDLDGAAPPMPLKSSLHVSLPEPLAQIESELGTPLRFSVSPILDSQILAGQAREERVRLGDATAIDDLGTEHRWSPSPRGLMPGPYQFKLPALGFCQEFIIAETSRQHRFEVGPLCRLTVRVGPSMGQELPPNPLVLERLACGARAFMLPSGQADDEVTFLAPQGMAQVVSGSAALHVEPTELDLRYDEAEYFVGLARKARFFLDFEPGDDGSGLRIHDLGALALIDGEDRVHEAGWATEGVEVSSGFVRRLVVFAPIQHAAGLGVGPGVLT